MKVRGGRGGEKEKEGARGKAGNISPDGRYQRKGDNRGWFIRVTGQLGNSGS